MNLVFAGTPQFAAVSLAALIAARHEVTLVLTQPDRPAGRGLKPQASAVKQLALSQGIPVLQPSTLKDPGPLEALAAARPEAMIVAAYGLLLPPAVLAVPARGCLNVHASLLPRWRGAAPIQRAILAGDAETGVTIMQMDAGLDTGPMLLARAVPIEQKDTAGELHDKLAALGARLIVEVLAGDPSPRAQDGATATYAPRIDKREATIDWTKPAAEIGRQVRAFDPVPGAQTRFSGDILKIWRARAEPGVDAAPGTVTAAGPGGVVVACGAQSLRVTELQRAGGKRLSAQAFLAGHPLMQGARLGGGDA